MAYSKKVSFKSFCIIILMLCFLMSMSLSGCSKNTLPINKSGYYFDTLINISIYDSELSEKKADSILDGCFLLCEKYDNMFSATKEGSDIYNLNHNQGKAVKVSDETLYLIQQSLYYSKLTNGLIDPTIASVSNLWDFTNPDNTILPDSTSISKALTHVGYKNINIHDNFVSFSDPETNIGLGFIAKGYIADKLKEYLLSQGVKSALINLGGNVLAIGRKNTDTLFTIGIQKPFDPYGNAITSLSIDDQSLVSSGNYERFFKKDGVIYHHILNPITGYPIQNNLYSVSILSDSSMEGDALSTTCYVLGLEQGMKLIESLDGIEAIFITDKYEIIKSSGLKK